MLHRPTVARWISVSRSVERTLWSYSHSNSLKCRRHARGNPSWSSTQLISTGSITKAISRMLKKSLLQNDIQLNRLYMKTGRHFEIQDSGHQGAFLTWHWPSKILFITNLAMYQVSCFYHKMHDFFTYPPHYMFRRNLAAGEIAIGVTVVLIFGDRYKLPHNYTQYKETFKPLSQSEPPPPPTPAKRKQNKKDEKVRKNTSNIEWVSTRLSINKWKHITGRNPLFFFFFDYVT